MSGSDNLSVRSHKLLGNFQILELYFIKSEKGEVKEVEAYFLETLIWKLGTEEHFVTM